MRAAWAAGAAGAAVAPFLLGLAVEDPPTPEQVKARWVAGAVTLVEVTDFDCPHCRRSEPVLAAFRREHPEVRFVRLVAPMPNHPNARPAGRAFLAARAQGLGEEMAVLLLAADGRDAARCRQSAERLKLDLAKYDRAVADPATDAELDETVGWAREAGTGLPLVWVQDRRIQGTPTSDALSVALMHARPGGADR